MKQLVCEMCDGTAWTKQDGFFICQGCGMKYSVDEAKKLMVDVEEKGSEEVPAVEIAVQPSESLADRELKNLYQAAKNAMEVNDSEMALKHYERISVLDPNNWEAVFYPVILKTEKIKNGEIEIAAVSIGNCLKKVLQLIHGMDAPEEDKIKAVETVYLRCLETATWLTSASNGFRQSLTRGNGWLALTGLSGMLMGAGVSYNATNENCKRCTTIANIMLILGDNIAAIFGTENEKYKEFTLQSWKAVITFDEVYRTAYKKLPLYTPESKQEIIDRIRKYEPDYQRNIQSEPQKQEKEKKKQLFGRKKNKVPTIISIALTGLAFLLTYIGFMLVCIELVDGGAMAACGLSILALFGTLPFSIVALVKKDNLKMPMFALIFQGVSAFGLMISTILIATADTYSYDYYYSEPNVYWVFTLFALIVNIGAIVCMVLALSDRKKAWSEFNK